MKMASEDIETIIKTIALKKEELDSEFMSWTNANGIPGFDDSDEKRFVEKLNPQLVDLYRGVAKVMSKYRSGILPKAFKIIPTLSNWEQILQLTEPNDWTAASMFEATKLFASNLKEDMAQRFYNIILLPRLRDDITEFKKLNFHLYNALKRSIYKPAAFFRGIILPLCEDSSETSMREAVIISSILKKTHVPLLHSAAAMLKIAEMPFSQPRGIFLMDLISKNYALPYKALDGLVDYFVRSTYNDKEELPVLWHQILLKFCQLYTRDISTEQREALLELIKRHKHHQISPEVRKILRNTESRDIEVGQNDKGQHKKEKKEVEGEMQDDDDVDEDDENENMDDDDD